MGRRRWHRRASLRWWLHLAGWVVFAAPAGLLLGGWFAPLGAITFEVLLTALVLRVRRVRVGRAPGPRGGGLGGVREPRRPLPTLGSGAAAAVPS